MIMKDVINCAHTKSGILLSDIPGARCLNTVVMTDTATSRPDTSVKVIICAQKSARLPGV